MRYQESRRYQSDGLPKQAVPQVTATAPIWPVQLLDCYRFCCRFSGNSGDFGAGKRAPMLVSYRSRATWPEPLPSGTDSGFGRRVLVRVQEGQLQSEPTCNKRVCSLSCVSYAVAVCQHMWRNPHRGTDLQGPLSEPTGVAYTESTAVAYMFVR